MPTRKISFANDEVYHTCNRGVDKRDIFLDEKDYLHCIHDFYEFNDNKPALTKFYETMSPKLPRTMLVDILAFALMPNHFHLLLKQKKEGGIVAFMHKFGVGYAMYFNQKYQRAGTLFQGPFRAVHVTNNAHFIHLPFYIHANPLDLIFPEWRERNLKNPEAAFEFLKQYRWSSFPDYIGIKNFPSVTERSFLTNFIGTPKKFESATLRLLKEMDVSIVDDIALEPIEKSL